MKTKKSRDITRAYSVKQFIAKIRRLANSLEKRGRFTIQVDNEKIRIPEDAVVNIEHERSKNLEELEFQVIWKPREK